MIGLKVVILGGGGSSSSFCFECAIAAEELGWLYSFCVGTLKCFRFIVCGGVFTLAAVDLFAATGGFTVFLLFPAGSVPTDVMISVSNVELALNVFS